MRRAGSLSGVPWTTVVSGILGIAAIAVIVSAHTRHEPPHRLLEPLGERPGSLMLVDLNGHPTDFRAQVGSRPAIVFVIGVADCASCASLPLEVRIAEKQMPGLTRIVVASGASIQVFRPYLTEQGRLDATVLVDEHRQFLHSLHLMMEPAVVVMDSTGRALFVDRRSTSQAAQYPVGRVLHDLVSILTSP